MGGALRQLVPVFGTMHLTSVEQGEQVVVLLPGMEKLPSPTSASDEELGKKYTGLCRYFGGLQQSIPTSPYQRHYVEEIRTALKQAGYATLVWRLIQSQSV